MPNLFKIGDHVKVMKHKWPELNTYQKKTVRGPDGKNYQYEISDSGLVGLVGRIIKINEEAVTEYEKETGDLQKYTVKFISKNPKIHDRISHFWEEQLAHTT